MLLCFSGFYYPASAQDMRNSAGSYSQYNQRSSGNYKAPPVPPGGSDVPISGYRDTPIGSGLGIIMGLGFCYLFYMVLKKTKKEEK